MKKAVDIVLLPPDDMMRTLIKANNALAHDESHTMHWEKTIPHLTLCMGIADNSQITNIIAKINTIAKQTNPITLTITSVEAVPKPNGKVVGSAHIEKTKQLMHLHEQILKKIQPLLETQAKPNMFHGAITEIPIWFIKNYHITKVGKQYEPHISLRAGVPNLPLPLSANTTRLALCHLGKSCTCQEILYEVTLKTNSL